MEPTVPMILARLPFEVHGRDGVSLTSNRIDSICLELLADTGVLSTVSVHVQDCQRTKPLYLLQFSILDRSANGSNSLFAVSLSSFKTSEDAWTTMRLARGKIRLLCRLCSAVLGDLSEKTEI